MGLATLLNVPYDERGMMLFSFSNANEHLKISEAIFRAFDLTINQQTLDPIPIHDIDGWLYRHQAVHDEENAILGLVSHDLTDLDIQDRVQLQDWTQLHFEEHRQAAAALELT